MVLLGDVDLFTRPCGHSKICIWPLGAVVMLVDTTAKVHLPH